ncbi:hypothetical protein [Campylobacter curvus]|uniref:hypothetical protein n=1 Tax=Campylobacter curvus TaxID=200 RepID=UPI001470455C|nr:hypothetical protein [Campylobacter curvus]
MKSLMMSGGSEWVLKTKTILLGSAEVRYSKETLKLKIFTINQTTFPSTQKNIKLVSVLLNNDTDGDSSSTPFKKTTLPLTLSLGFPNITVLSLNGWSNEAVDTSIIAPLYTRIKLNAQRTVAASIYVIYQCLEQE